MALRILTKNLVAGDSAVLAWSDEAPVTICVVQANAAPPLPSILRRFQYITANFYVWNVDIAAGTSVAFTYIPDGSPEPSQVSDPYVILEPSPTSSSYLQLSSAESNLIEIPKSSVSVTGGGYYDVFSGIFIPTGVRLALKRPRFFTQTATDAEKAKNRFEAESNLWKNLAHPNVLPFYGFVTVHNNSYLVSPWMIHGDLATFVSARIRYLDLPQDEQSRHAQRAAFDRFDEYTVVFGIASGLAYLHSQDIVHGDVRAANVLLDGEVQPVLCDLGLSAVTDRLNLNFTALRGAGSVRWLSPEVLESSPKSTRSDMYAFGLTIGEMLTGTVPFASLTHAPLFRAIASGQIPPFGPHLETFRDLRRLAACCRDVDPDKRPAAAAVEQIHDGPSVEAGFSLFFRSFDEAGGRIVATDADNKEDYYQLHQCLVKSQFGEVYRASNVDTGEQVAVKRVRLDDLNETTIRQLVEEAELFKTIQHPRILEHRGVARNNNYLDIVQEYMESGALGRSMGFGSFHERLVAAYVPRILDGLSYLHHRQVIHGNLKATNILSTSDGNIKLSGFGVALALTAIERSKKSRESREWTCNWMAPELVHSQQASPASDIWSLGCTVVELLTGRPPYSEGGSGEFVMARLNADDRPPIPTGCSEPLQDFLSQCFRRNSVQRPTAEALTWHSWLQRPAVEHKQAEARGVIASLPHSFVAATFDESVHCRACCKDVDVKDSAAFCEICGIVYHNKCANDAGPSCSTGPQQPPSRKPSAHSQPASHAEFSRPPFPSPSPRRSLLKKCIIWIRRLFPRRRAFH